MFYKGFENGFEIKEKKEKKIRKNKIIFKVVKFILGSLTKFSIFNREVYLKLYLNLI